MFGSTGKMLRVNLTDGKSKEEQRSEEDVRKFFGGRCLGAKILFDELKPGIDPLSPENKLVFATGPITGLPFPGNSRFIVMAKSPLTGILGEALAGGFFGPELKFSGYDALIVEGSPDAPVYLWIHDGETEIRDAGHLWGKTTGETEKSIRSEVRDEKARVACIGPGGENLVKYASVMSDVVDAAGRCGMGAVMGHKKLKAIAVRGRGKIKMADPEKFRELAKKAYDESWKGWGKALHEHGTDGFLDGYQATGRLPTKNFRRGTFDGYDKIDGLSITNTILVDRKSCFACRNACKRVVKVSEPYAVDPTYGGPEYETAVALGSFCMNNNLGAIAKANELCNKYGIDTISTGVVVAFAMECYENGLLTKEDLDGLDLAWGNHGAIVQLTEKIAKREGIGNLLADGVKIAVEKIGKGADKYAMHVKGLELPMHEPRGKVGLGLSYATSNRGGCHNQVPHDDYWGEGTLVPEIGLDSTLDVDRFYTGPEKAKLVMLGENCRSILNSLVVCYFTSPTFSSTGGGAGITVDTMLGLVSSITGWDTTPRELMTVGERAWNLCRAFNVREGITRRDDTLPERLMEPLPDGPCKDKSIPRNVLEKMLDYYYEARGWNKATGIPTRKKLEDLSLKYVADKLELAS